MDNLKSLILDTDDGFFEPIDVPHWPHTKDQLFIRSMDGSEYAKYLDLISRSHTDPQGATPEKNAPIDIAAWVSSVVLVDKDRNRIFSEADTIDLTKKNGYALHFIFNAWFLASTKHRKND